MNDTPEPTPQDPAHLRWHHDGAPVALVEAGPARARARRTPPAEARRHAATMRAYYGFLWGQPGERLLFTGREFGRTAEWDPGRSPDWHLARYGIQGGMRHLIRDLDAVCGATPALRARGREPESFRWVVAHGQDASVLAWLRYGGPGDAPVLVVSNFTPAPREACRLGLPCAGPWAEALNTDAALYGGSNLGNPAGVVARAEPSHGFPASAEVVLPPLATIYLRSANAGTH